MKMDKERFKLRRKYVLNSLNEPQHLAKIKTLNLPKIQNKELEKLRERKLQNNELIPLGQTTKVSEKLPL